MHYNDLPSFLKLLKKKGLLVEVEDEISTILEVTELHRQVLHSGGPALLLKNVRTENGKANMPMLVNLFGTVERVALGLGLDSANELEALGEMLAFMKQPKPPASLTEAFSKLPLLKAMMSMKPKKVKGGRSQEVVHLEPNLDMLPIQTCWPNEPAPLITWSMVITEHAQTKQVNVGIYRMQKLTRNELIVRWLDHRGGADHYRSWKEAGHDKMPISVVIGSDPCSILAAVMPLPEDVSELQFAGLLRKSRLELTKCKTNELYVPANAEIVLEGYVDLKRTEPEGPYGDHTGYYNSIEQFPVMTVSAITHAKDPMYLSTYTGRPPDEPAVLGEALNHVFTPMLKAMVPEVVDFYLPPEGCSYRIGVISIKKSYPGHARKVMMAIWSQLRQFMYTKFLIVVDHNINVRDWKDVMWAISTKMDFARDVQIIENTPIDYLDFASPKTGLGSKIGFDATDKIGSETEREWGKEINMDPEVVLKMQAIYKKL